MSLWSWLTTKSPENSESPQIRNSKQLFTTILSHNATVSPAHRQWIQNYLANVHDELTLRTKLPMFLVEFTLANPSTKTPKPATSWIPSALMIAGAVVLSVTLGVHYSTLTSTSETTHEPSAPSPNEDNPLLVAPPPPPRSPPPPLQSSTKYLTLSTSVPTLPNLTINWLLNQYNDPNKKTNTISNPIYEKWDQEINSAIQQKSWQTVAERIFELHSLMSIHSFARDIFSHKIKNSIFNRLVYLVFSQPQLPFQDQQQWAPALFTLANHCGWADTQSLVHADGAFREYLLHVIQHKDAPDLLVLMSMSCYMQQVLRANNEQADEVFQYFIPLLISRLTHPDNVKDKLHDSLLQVYVVFVAFCRSWIFFKTHTALASRIDLPLLQKAYQQFESIRIKYNIPSIDWKTTPFELTVLQKQTLEVVGGEWPSITMRPFPTPVCTQKDMQTYYDNISKTQTVDPQVFITNISFSLADGNSACLCTFVLALQTTNPTLYWVAQFRLLQLMKKQAGILQYWEDEQAAHVRHFVYKALSDRNTPDPSIYMATCIIRQVTTHNPQSFSKIQTECNILNIYQVRFAACGYMDTINLSIVQTIHTFTYTLLAYATSCCKTDPVLQASDPPSNILITIHDIIRKIEALQVKCQTTFETNLIKIVLPRVLVPPLNKKPPPVVAQKKVLSQTTQQTYLQTHKPNQLVLADNNPFKLAIFSIVDKSENITTAIQTWPTEAERGLLQKMSDMFASSPFNFAALKTLITNTHINVLSNVMECATAVYKHKFTTLIADLISKAAKIPEKCECICLFLLQTCRLRHMGVVSVPITTENQKKLLDELRGTRILREALIRQMLEYMNDTNATDDLVHLAMEVITLVTCDISRLQDKTFLVDHISSWMQQVIYKRLQVIHQASVDGEMEEDEYLTYKHAIALVKLVKTFNQFDQFCNHVIGLIKLIATAKNPALQQEYQILMEETTPQKTAAATAGTTVVYSQQHTQTAYPKLVTSSQMISVESLLTDMLIENPMHKDDYLTNALASAEKIGTSFLQLVRAASNCSFSNAEFRNIIGQMQHSVERKKFISCQGFYIWIYLYNQIVRQSNACDVTYIQNFIDFVGDCCGFEPEMATFALTTGSIGLNMPVFLRFVLMHLNHIQSTDLMVCSCLSTIKEITTSTFLLSTNNVHVFFQRVLKTYQLIPIVYYRIKMLCDYKGTASSLPSLQWIAPLQDTILILYNLCQMDKQTKCMRRWLDDLKQLESVTLLLSMVPQTLQSRFTHSMSNEIINFVHTHLAISIPTPSPLKQQNVGSITRIVQNGLHIPISNVSYALASETVRKMKTNAPSPGDLNSILSVIQADSYDRVEMDRLLEASPKYGFLDSTKILRTNAENGLLHVLNYLFAHLSPLHCLQVLKKMHIEGLSNEQVETTPDQTPDVIAVKKWLFTCAVDYLDNRQLDFPIVHGALEILDYLCDEDDTKHLAKLTSNLFKIILFHLERMQDKSVTTIASFVHAIHIITSHRDSTADEDTKTKIIKLCETHAAHSTEIHRAINQYPTTNEKNNFTQRDFLENANITSLTPTSSSFAFAWNTNMVDMSQDTTKQFKPFITAIQNDDDDKLYELMIYFDSISFSTIPQQKMIDFWRYVMKHVFVVSKKQANYKIQQVQQLCVAKVLLSTKSISLALLDGLFASLYATQTADEIVDRIVILFADAEEIDIFSALCKYEFMPTMISRVLHGIDFGSFHVHIQHCLYKMFLNMHAKKITLDKTQQGCVNQAWILASMIALNNRDNPQIVKNHVFISGLYAYFRTKRVYTETTISIPSTFPSPALILSNDATKAENQLNTMIQGKAFEGIVHAIVTNDMITAADKLSALFFHIGDVSNLMQESCMPFWDFCFYTVFQSVKSTPWKKEHQQLCVAFYQIIGLVNGIYTIRPAYVQLAKALLTVGRIRDRITMNDTLCLFLINDVNLLANDQLNSLVVERLVYFVTNDTTTSKVPVNLLVEILRRSSNISIHLQHVESAIRAYRDSIDSTDALVQLQIALLQEYLFDLKPPITTKPPPRTTTTTTTIWLAHANTAPEALETASSIPSTTALSDVLKMMKGYNSTDQQKREQFFHDLYWYMENKATTDEFLVAYCDLVQKLTPKTIEKWTGRHEAVQCQLTKWLNLSSTSDLSVLKVMDTLMHITDDDNTATRKMVYRFVYPVLQQRIISITKSQDQSEFVVRVLNLMNQQLIDATSRHWTTVFSVPDTLQTMQNILDHMQKHHLGPENLRKNVLLHLQAYQKDGMNSSDTVSNDVIDANITRLIQPYPATTILSTNDALEICENIKGQMFQLGEQLETLIGLTDCDNMQNKDIAIYDHLDDKDIIKPFAENKGFTILDNYLFARIFNNTVSIPTCRTVWLQTVIKGLKTCVSNRPMMQMKMKDEFPNLYHLPLWILNQKNIDLSIIGSSILAGTSMVDSLERSKDYIEKGWFQLLAHWMNYTLNKLTNIEQHEFIKHILSAVSKSIVQFVVYEQTDPNKEAVPHTNPNKEAVPQLDFVKTHIMAPCEAKLPTTHNSRPNQDSFAKLRERIASTPAPPLNTTTANDNVIHVEIAKLIPIYTSMLSDKEALAICEKIGNQNEEMGAQLKTIITLTDCDNMEDKNMRIEEHLDGNSLEEMFRNHGGYAIFDKYLLARIVNDNAPNARCKWTWSEILLHKFTAALYHKPEAFSYVTTNHPNLMMMPLWIINHKNADKNVISRGFYSIGGVASTNLNTSKDYIAKGVFELAAYWLKYALNDTSTKSQLIEKILFFMTRLCAFFADKAWNPTLEAMPRYDYIKTQIISPCEQKANALKKNEQALLTRLQQLRTILEQQK